MSEDYGVNPNSRISYVLWRCEKLEVQIFGQVEIYNDKYM